MKSFLPLPALLLLLACDNAPIEEPNAAAANAAGVEAPPAAAQTQERYDNERFGFSVSAPPGFRMGEAPANNDGRLFVDPATGAEFRAFASHNALGRSFEEQVEAARDGLDGPAGTGVEGRTYRGTGTDGEGRRVHIRLVAGPDDRLVTLLFRYPKDAEARMAPVAERTLDSLRLTDRVGPVSFRYDPGVLLPVPAAIAVPPAWDKRAEGLKLLAADRAAMMGKAECMYGQSGRASPCNPEQEAGLAIAVVDRSYEEAKAALTDPPTTAMHLAGRPGVSWEIGAEGEGADHMLAALDGRTLLVVRQHRESGNPDAEAVQAVLQSLAIAD